MTRALGRYELLRPLARGGMAEVYLARRRAAGIEKWLVVKRMRPERSGDARFLDLFVREARLSMSLVHQNIVPVFDFGRIDDQVFLAMERVEGKDLGSSLARAKGHHLPPLLAAFIAAECCQALDYAHQRKSPEGVALGIVHRDVTPRNVLLSWSGEVKLTDFGIAALAGDATSRLLGTPHYMAPEQARGEPIDPRADIYAIGLVLREAVSGTRPRPGADRETLLDAARRGELVPWPDPAAPASEPASALDEGGAHTPGAGASHAALPPAALVEIIDRATAVLPGDRYPDVRSMLEELDSFIVGQRAAHKAESPARQLAAWLAGTWEDARDDIETDAAIDAEHLVSFLDDGAFDVMGTGTIRSLAATAADDAPAAPLPPGAPSGSGGPATEPAMRSGKISSSNTTVASGSFHTIPALGVHAAAGKLPGSGARRRKSRQMPSLVSLLFAGLAAGAVVFFLMRNHDEDGQPSLEGPRTGNPTTGQPNMGQPNAGQPTAGRPTAERPTAEQPTAGQPTVRQPTAEQSTAEQPTAEQPTAGQPTAGQPTAGQPTAGQSSAGQPHTDQPHTDQPHTGPPHTGRPHTGHGPSTPGAGHDGSGSGGPDAGEGSNRIKPALCQVRINLTPWAYYTADEDSTRHETPSTIGLTPGPHRIHVWNPELHVERDITINVPADRDTMNYSEALQPSMLPPSPGP